MRLARYLVAGATHLGLVEDDGVRPLDDLGFTSMMALVAEGDAALDRIRAALGALPSARDLAEVELLAPLERPGKYLAIGMNYAKHVAEAERLGIARQSRQYWFNKQTSCIAGPFDPIQPGVSEQVDYECELGVVIGRPAKGISAADALGHVFGYVVANDVSARDWQHHSPTFTMGKSFDTHGPIGPWIVTADEIPDPQALALHAWVNGELRQSSRTSEMVHPVAEQIAYLSTAFTLESGDLIATGTPEGVGAAMEPPTFLTTGDVVRCQIEGLGYIQNIVA